MSSKDTPIIFSAPMVRALLEGRKTMTRRIVSLSNCEFGSIPAGKLSKLYWQHAEWKTAWTDRGFPDSDGVHRHGYLHVPCHAGNDNNHCVECYERGWDTTTHRLRPKVLAGERLWVREAVAYIDNSEFDAPSYWQYRADTDGEVFPGDWPEEESDNPDRPRWKPSIHMPRVASRITLIQSAVKIEPLQAISEADAIAEGVHHVGGKFDGCYIVQGTGIMSGTTAAECFRRLWQSLHGDESWDQNPFVVAITFRIIKANIDAPEARIAA